MSRIPYARHARHGAVALAALALVAAAPLQVASADPGPVFPSQKQVDQAKSAVSDTSSRIASLDAQYATASARLSDVQDKAAAAGEDYNGAMFRLGQATAAANAAQQRAAKAQGIADAASLVVRRYAATVYQQGGNFGELDAFLSSNGPQDMMDRATALQAVGDARARTLEQASATAIVADLMKRQAAQAQAVRVKAAADAKHAHDVAQAEADQAQAAATAIQTQQQGLIVQLATLRKTSVTLEKQRQDGLAAAAAARAAAAEAARQAQLAAQRAQAARDAAARAAAQQEAARAAAEAAQARAAAEAAQRAADQLARQRASSSNSAPASVSSTPSGPSSSAPPPPPSGGVGAVIAYAEAQLGKPYQWGASGPDSFDCSGLTMMAWAQAGVSLSHYTGAQWDETSRVAISDLRPGDLVFYGTDGPSSHHVGLYIGNGSMIEAPHTGADVRIASIYRDDLLGGGRP